jgi:poly-beta-1,6-N-acetyl-D-glucosamine synthase
MQSMVIAFGVCTLGLAYIFVGYPVLIRILASVAGRRTRPHRGPLDSQPTSIDQQPSGALRVSVVMSVYNDRGHLARKLDSLLTMHGAEQIAEIWIGSDGSTDGVETDSVLSCDPRVQLVCFAERRGKPSVLNDLVAQATGDVILFTDARQTHDPACLQALLQNFRDPEIGVVSGELVLRESRHDTAAAEGIGFYWKYEKWIRKHESQFRGVPGATGACYALRRTAYRPLPPGIILDDVAIPLQAVSLGYRCVFEPAAKVFDQPSQSVQQESIRKRRTIAGAAQLVRLYPHWLLPGWQPLWWEFLSHKVLRLVSPVLLVLAFVLNVGLAIEASRQPDTQWNGALLWTGLLLLQTVFYLAASWGWWLQRRGIRSKWFGAALMFLTLNMTTGAALWDALCGRYRVAWKKAAG